MTNQELIESLFIDVEPHISKSAVELQKIFATMKWQWELGNIKYSPSYVDILNVVTNILKDLRVSIFNHTGPLRRDQRFYMCNCKIVITIFYENARWQMTIGLDYNPVHIFA